MNPPVHFQPSERLPVLALFRRSLIDTVAFSAWFLAIFYMLGLLSHWIPILYAPVATCYLAGLRLLVMVFGRLLPDVPVMIWSYLMWIAVPFVYAFLFWAVRFVQLLVMPSQVRPTEADRKSVLYGREVARRFPE